MCGWHFMQSFSIWFVAPTSSIPIFSDCEKQEENGTMCEWSRFDKRGSVFPPDECVICWFASATWKVRFSTHNLSLRSLNDSNDFFSLPFVISTCEDGYTHAGFIINGRTDNDFMMSDFFWCACAVSGNIHSVDGGDIVANSVWLIGCAWANDRWTTEWVS